MVTPDTLMARCNDDDWQQRLAKNERPHFDLFYGKAVIEDHCSVKFDETKLNEPIKASTTAVNPPNIYIR